MKNILENIAKRFKRQEVRTPEGPKIETRIESVEDAWKYLQAVKEAAQKMKDGEYEAPEVKITTATSIERREFLNYCISLMPDKYIKHKILLFLRVNPYFENPATGQEFYLSVREVARALTHRVGKRVTEIEVLFIEREALKIARDSVSACKRTNIPLVGNNSF